MSKKSFKEQKKEKSNQYYKTLIEHIDTFGKGLTKWEIKFTANLIDTKRKEFSTKQREIIDRIYNEKT